MSNGRNLFIVCRNKNGYSDRIAVLVFAMKQRLAASVQLTEYGKSLEKNDIKRLKGLLASVLTADFIADPKSGFAAEPFYITVPEKQDEKDRCIHLHCFGAVFSIKTGNSAQGNAVRVINFIQKSDEYHKKIKAGCEILEAKIAADKNTTKKSGVYDSRIDELQNKRNELFQIINH